VRFKGRKYGLGITVRCLSLLRSLVGCLCFPTAYAVGFILAPLRGCIRCQSFITGRICADVKLTHTSQNRARVGHRSQEDCLHVENRLRVLASLHASGRGRPPHTSHLSPQSAQPFQTWLDSRGRLSLHPQARWTAEGTTHQPKIFSMAAFSSSYCMAPGW
jgi:hypothetical protein